ncbi:hypothetical protein [Urbifossiella limnaea]|uniref:Helix-turn-helix domain-containing protein n=1 Tax=Urbifossiella limnaea TaxID=2528023 RepID=A0A517XUU8_9BACT|nr:hypothetical protein [Urbifossiella limnaea]QDU21264.1 hypothetical protein ETAA1_32300 [Urbifossiella limnaea]
MPDPFDPARLDPADFPPPTTPPRPRPGVKFLRGPIPMDWLTAAAALPGRALAVGLVVWFLAGCERRRTVAATLSRLAALGAGTRAAARRGLAALEAAGLVAVERHPGRSPVVTILDAPG